MNDERVNFSREIENIKKNQCKFGPEKYIPSQKHTSKQNQKPKTLDGLNSRIMEGQRQRKDK